MHGANLCVCLPGMQASQSLLSLLPHPCKGACWPRHHARHLLTPAAHAVVSFAHARSSTLRCLGLQAAPQVAGAAALYAARYPAATATQIKAALLSSAVFTPSLVGKCRTGGRLDVAAMLGIVPA
jgi:hypothetical protein